ncbi:hypothetical protein LS70_009635 [Helicobacter sp. MIT 11-5569]|uniref:Cj0814 family flagellar-dependent secreted protein n=1 Tax=Helicobacter sp. MIT 11-5569 TaxID=1548151 RepID=UPI0010FF046D|nr:hypothetical protein [Helicobacter sp. MIT 11-5569]TLD79743.1 hypothetical protein LS70_009635 [Helicobacter sp. MIT 11-5569]
MINSIHSNFTNPLANLKPRNNASQERQAEQSTNAQNSAKTSEASNKVLGYAIDKDGYFTEEFNKAAGIPEDYKIHSSTMESLVDKTTNKFTNPLRTFRSLDIAKTVGNAYKILSQVVGEDVLNSKDSFSTQDIVKFPQGYKYNSQTMQVSEIYKTTADLENAWNSFGGVIPIGGRPDRMYLSNLFYNGTMNPVTDVFNNANGGATSNFHFDMTREKYTNPDGSITKGGLLIGVINANLHTREGEATPNGKSQGYDKSMSYLEVINYDASKDPDQKGRNEDRFYITGPRPLKLIKSEESLRMDKEWEEYLKNYKDPTQMLMEQILGQQKLSLEELEKKRKELKAKIIKRIDIDI